MIFPLSQFHVECKGRLDIVNLLSCHASNYNLNLTGIYRRKVRSISHER